MKKKKVTEMQQEPLPVVGTGEQLLALAVIKSAMKDLNKPPTHIDYGYAKHFFRSELLFFWVQLLQFPHDVDGTIESLKKYADSH